MKYLFIKATNHKENSLTPIDAPLFIEYRDGTAYLSLGGRLLMDLDEHNKTALLPFLAEAFNRVDVVTIDCHSAPFSPTVKRGLEE